MAECLEWQYFPNPAPPAVTARAIAILHLDPPYGVYSTEQIGPDLVQFIVARHPPDEQNPLPHKGVEAKRCVKFASSPASYVEGIDVSDAQGTIEWSRVFDAGKRFAWVKSSEGLPGSYKQPQTFAANIDGANGAGVVTGAYHYFRPDKDGALQAESMWRIVEPHFARIDMPLALDVEEKSVSQDVNAGGVKFWTERIHQLSGKRPLIYTSPGLWTSIVGKYAGELAANADLWVAHWGVNTPTMPEGWSSARFWQYSDHGAVDGIAGAVDLNRFIGDAEAFASWLGVNVPPAPPGPPPQPPGPPPECGPTYDPASAVGLCIMFGVFTWGDRFVERLFR